MKRIAIIAGIWFALAAVLLYATSHGACRVATRTSHVVVANQAIVAQPNYVVTAYAIPVGVPVAPYASYWYSSTQYMSQQQPAATAQADGLEEHRGGKDAALALFRAKCARCHSGADPKAGLDLSEPANLDSLTRLKAVREVLAERMPKGGKLSAVEAGQILDVLSREAAVASDGDGGK